MKTSMMKRIIRKAAYVITDTADKLMPVRKNKIFVSCYQGRGFCDNPKPVVEAILKKSRNADIVCVLNDSHFDDVLPEGVRKVRFGSLKQRYEMSTSKVWIDNMRILYGPYKRNDQVYFQLWHAPIMLKKVEKDAAYLSDYYISCAKKDSEMADYLVSGSGWLSDVYRSSFWYDGEILECGTPRFDKLINKDFHEEDIARAASVIGFDRNKKAVLYAPTFRNDGDEAYDMDYDRVIDCLEKEFGGDWIMMIRFHPNVADKYKDVGKDNPRIINVTSYPDLYELVPLVDLLITDYSSTMFEFSLAGKNVMIYASDLIHYSQQERGLYFKMEDLPFSLAENTDKLIDNIVNFNQEEYAEKVSQFFKNKLRMKETGKASEVLADMILSIIGD